MRSSASEWASCSAPGGSSPSARRISAVDSWRIQISGRKTTKNPRTGVDTQSAMRSGCPSAIPFGTSSPSTTCRYVTISSATITARIEAITVSRWCASTCSPRAPIPRLVMVTPSCIAEMKRGGSPVIRNTARARRLPSCSSSMIRVRREVTRPYSAATKNAFSVISPNRANSCSRKVTGSRAPKARAYWAADRRPRESVRAV